MSGYEAILVEVLTRLLAGSNLVADMTRVRRAHRQLLPRSTSDSDYSRAVHVIDGADELDKDGRNASCAQRKGSFTISLFARSDLGPTVIDALKIEVNSRMSAAFAAGTVIAPGRISIEIDEADEDAIRVDMEYSARYGVAGEWALS